MYMAQGKLVSRGAPEAQGPNDQFRLVKVEKVALNAVDTAGGVFNWTNPSGRDAFIQRITIDATTKATAACTIDVGTTATSATTSTDNLLDGLDVGTAAGAWDNGTTPGTNGKAMQRLTAGKWITASKATGATAGLVGYAYIQYVDA